MKFENKKGYVKPPINPHHEPYVDELNSLLESQYEHDDRSMVLNIAAFAEDTLELILLIYLREKKQAKELVTGFNAPLGTFSARIKAVFVLGLIHKDGYKTLEILRKVRNKFAHDWKGVSFDREDIASLINKLSNSRQEEFEQLTSEEDKQKIPVRYRFMYKVSDILIDLRILAKALDKSGEKAPIVMSSDRKPVHFKIIVVENFDDDAS